jgi:ABC-2 type transport system ATP-binding protein
LSPAAHDAPNRRENASSGAPAALAVSGVSHRFGARVALENVSIEIVPGAFAALVGPNGAGKTTLFSIVTGLYHNRTGRVFVFGHDLHREPARALAELGIVFQNRTLDGDLTVRQNLLYHAALHGIPRRRATPRVEDLIGLVGLSERLDDKARHLSGGQARRVEIARALIHGPRLLLLDEATVGLDLASRAAIVALVRELVRARGLSVLWATHILDEIEPEDDAYILHRGAVVAHGKARDLARGGSLEAAVRAVTADAA